MPSGPVRRPGHNGVFLLGGGLAGRAFPLRGSGLYTESHQVRFRPAGEGVCEVVGKRSFVTV